jgi:hypothetical protein
VYCEDDPIGGSDPSGAIMTLDDDGKVDAYEASAYAASRARSNKKRYEYFMRRARAQHKRWLAQRQAAARARVAAIQRAKAAAAERKARMAMAQARQDASLAMKAAATGDGAVSTQGSGGLTHLGTTFSAVGLGLAIGAAIFASGPVFAGLVVGGLACSVIGMVISSAQHDNGDIGDAEYGLAMGLGAVGMALTGAGIPAAIAGAQGVGAALGWTGVNVAGTGLALAGCGSIKEACGR